MKWPLSGHSSWPLVSACCVLSIVGNVLWAASHLVPTTSSRVRCHATPVSGSENRMEGTGSSYEGTSSAESLRPLRRASGAYCRSSTFWGFSVCEPLGMCPQAGHCTCTSLPHRFRGTFLQSRVQLRAGRLRKPLGVLRKDCHPRPPAGPDARGTLGQASSDTAGNVLLGGDSKLGATRHQAAGWAGDSHPYPQGPDDRGPGAVQMSVG